MPNGPRGRVSPSQTVLQHLHPVRTTTYTILKDAEMAPKRKAEQQTAVQDPKKLMPEFQDNDVRDKTEDVVQVEEAVALARVLCAMRGQKFEMPHAVEMAVG